MHIHRYVESCAHTCPGVGGWLREAAPHCRGPCPRRHSGLLSALGLALADVVHEAQEAGGGALIERACLRMALLGGEAIV